MTGAGELNQTIGFERNTAGRTAMGGAAAPSWTPLGSRKAKILYGTGAERRAAAGEQAVQPATFRVRADTLTKSITQKDRITVDGLAWDITSIAPIGGPSPTFIDFTAMASRD